MEEKVQKTNNGVAPCNLYNIVQLLKNHKQWKDVLSLNIDGHVVYSGDPPYKRMSSGPLQEGDYMRIRYFLSASLHGNPSKRDLRDAVRIVAEDNSISM